MNRNLGFALIAFIVVIATAVILIGVVTANGDGDGNNDGISGNNSAATPTATRTATPVSQTMLTAEAPDGNTTVCPGDHEVGKDETYDVAAGCNVKGDVEDNCQELYASDQTTGMIVSCPHGWTIIAP